MGGNILLLKYDSFPSMGSCGQKEPWQHMIEMGRNILLLKFDSFPTNRALTIYDRDVWKHTTVKVWFLSQHEILWTNRALTTNNHDWLVTPISFIFFAIWAPSFQSRGEFDAFTASCFLKFLVSTCLRTSHSANPNDFGLCAYSSQIESESSLYF